MFRRRELNLPQDPRFSTNLKKLGYFINDNDQIKSIKHPEDDFRFFITNNERYNEVQREAMHACIRKEVSRRLTSINVPLLHLPNFTTSPPPAPTPHLPIHCTPISQLRTKKRIIVLVNRAQEDLAILSYRVLSKTGGINAGSAVAFVKEIQDRAATLAQATGRDVESETPGVVILNPGQLLFSHKQGRAMTQTSWMALPRKSAVHPPIRISEKHNRVEGNTSPAEHVHFVFEKLLGNPEFVQPDAELYVVGLGEGADDVLQYLQENPGRHHIAAIATTAPVPSLPTTCSISLSKENAPFLQLLSNRARAWCLSPHELNKPLANPTPIDRVTSAASPESFAEAAEAAYQEVALFPMMSGGTTEHAECVMTVAMGAILDWFEEVVFVGGSGEVSGGAGQAYKNGVLDVSEEMQKETLNLTPPQPTTWA